MSTNAARVPARAAPGTVNIDLVLGSFVPSLSDPAMPPPLSRKRRVASADQATSRTRPTARAPRANHDELVHQYLASGHWNDLPAPSHVELNRAASALFQTDVLAAPLTTFEAMHRETAELKAKATRPTKAAATSPPATSVARAVTTTPAGEAARPAKRARALDTATDDEIVAAILAHDKWNKYLQPPKPDQAAKLIEQAAGTVFADPLPWGMMQAMIDETMLTTKVDGRLRKPIADKPKKVSAGSLYEVQLDRYSSDCITGLGPQPSAPPVVVQMAVC